MFKKISMKRVSYKIFKVISFTIFFLLNFNFLTFGQQSILKNELLTINNKSNSLTRKSPSEKLYLQFDKPYYAVGDTIWFKAYLFNAAYLTASDKSGILNIDIANDSNKVVKQYRFPVQAGLSWGNISLDDKDFATGTYTLRVYTNWMRNFGDDYFFYKIFYVSNANENSLLVNQQVNTSIVNGSNTANVKLQFSDINKKFIRVEPFELQVMGGNKRLYKQKLQTDINGLVDVNFMIPSKATNLVIVAESDKKDKKAVIPILLNRPENADMQFLPEGGNLIAGLPAHIGFKAIGEDGKGIEVSGIISDHIQKQVAVFKSLHNGMGSFDLTAKDGESYIAKVTLPNGAVKEYSLPIIKVTGTILQVKNDLESDSIEVAIGATNDMVQSNEDYFLIGKARGIVCYAAIVNLHEGNLVKRKIAKSLFPSGITHFILMTEKYQPLNERLVFIDHHDNLNIKFSTGKPAYGSRDSVTIKLKVTDKEDNPIRGSFSIATTDDAQIKTDNLNNENIITHLLFTSDLKGYIEEPGYYLSKTEDAWRAMDNLLLTQGWVGYNWQQIINPSIFQYQPETEFSVTGSVLNAFNKPVKGANVVLLSKSPSLLMDTVTDNNGRFLFHHFPRVDTPQFILKAVNKNGKSFNVGITMDEIKPPDFIKKNLPFLEPWYVNSDSTLLNYAKSNVLAKQQQYFTNNGHVLKEVKITAKKIIKGSQNLNGPGNADLVLDEKDLEAAGKKTWLQLLQENVKGFKIGEVKKQWFFILDIKDPVIIDRQMASGITQEHEWFLIKDKPVKFYVDGISITDAYPPTTLDVVGYSGGFESMKNFLNTHSAEDIKGIEVNFSDKYTSTYTSIKIPSQYQLYIHQDDISFIEITTRSGHGPIIDNTPGMYLYKPLPISYPKQFYKPKYTVNDTSKRVPDLRSTIDWEPNVVTDTNGEAKVSFFTADKPSTYTVIIEGSDMNGNLGYKQGKITVVKGETK